MVTGILTWHNQNGKSSYPLSKSDAVMDDFIVDANFVQFDNFVPVLQSVIVSETDLSITVTFDLLTLTVSYLKSSFVSGVRHLSFYDNSTNKRFLGRLVFGNGANTLWNSYSNQEIIFGIPFLSNTVRSIPSTDAVYSIDGRYGQIVFSHTSSDAAIFYNTNPTNKWICFNAVQNSRLPDVIPNVLKLLNLIAPVDNNVSLGYNDIIQVKSTLAGTLNISLIATDFTPSSVVPTLSK